jgi:exonuclease III
MTEEITAMTWNVNGAGGISQTTIQSQIDFFADHHQDTDLFLLQDVKYEKQGEDNWGGHLGKLIQYFEKSDYHCEHTADWDHQFRNLDVQPYQNITSPFKRCKLTASRWDMDRNPLDLSEMRKRNPEHLNYFYANFPTSILVTDIHHPTHEVTDNEGLQIWNGSAIHGAGWKEEKINILETIYSQIFLQNDQTEKMVVLGGDFNAPKKEIRKETEGGVVGEIIPHDSGKLYFDKPFYGNPYRYQNEDTSTVKFPFKQRWGNAESYIFDSEKNDWEMKDAYWHADHSAKQSSADDYTHDFHRDNVDNKRLDHLLADNYFNIKHCEIQNGINVEINGSRDGSKPSDHAPVKAILEIKT